MDVKNEGLLPLFAEVKQLLDPHAERRVVATLDAGTRAANDGPGP